MYKADKKFMPSGSSFSQGEAKNKLCGKAHYVLENGKCCGEKKIREGRLTMAGKRYNFKKGGQGRPH